jgi:microcystin degradation protein MlrC
MPGPRVAILGFILESNRFAPPVGEADFRDYYWLEGDDILVEARGDEPRIAPEAAAFVRAMDATGPWRPHPILLAASHPGGPVEGPVFAKALERIVAGLRRVPPADAVYVANHGAMVATDADDPDGALIEAVRAAVGAKARVVVTLDLHANISERMVSASDLVVGYRTNPHVDMVQRGEEAALALRLMLAGRADPKAVLVRLPLTPPSVTLLTGEGPYGEIIDLGQRRQAEAGGAILNVSVFGGFAFSDTPKNGFAAVVTARRERAAAERLARELAERAWAERRRFRRRLTPLAEAVALACRGDRAPVIFSDAGDNPGGGGSGRTTELLRALVDAGAEGVLYGSFFDAPLAAEARDLGLGARFRARFNRHPGTRYDVSFAADAEVVGLHDGDVVGRLGLHAGRRLALGPSAALRLGGITAVVISDRCQTADPVLFEMFALDVAAARTVVVKSRGHFRAGFAPWFPPERVYEVDTAGFTSPVLERLPWRGLPRPVYPLDEDAEWTPPRSH